MNDTTLIILCAGESSRFSHSPKKQWLRCADEPLWLYVVNKFIKIFSFAKIIVVGHENEISYMKNYSSDVEFCIGGDSRQTSIKNGLQNVTTKFTMVSDVARACVPFDIVTELHINRNEADIIVPVLDIADTVIYQGETINRDQTKLIQTPQLSVSSRLREALNSDYNYTDDSSAIKAIGGTVKYIKGSSKSIKLTNGIELEKTDCLPTPSNDYFVGTGIDIHSFTDDKKMYLGGTYIDSGFGFKAHSDGDVLIHSVIDALLGASGAGDIGEFFPDTDIRYKDADSRELLKEIVNFVRNVGYEIINVDVSIIAQVPKINPYKLEIKKNMSNLLQIPIQKFNIKATTAENLGFIGRKEAIAVQSSATLKYYNWKDIII